MWLNVLVSFKIPAAAFWTVSTLLSTPCLLETALIDAVTWTQHVCYRAVIIAELVTNVSEELRNRISISVCDQIYKFGKESLNVYWDLWMCRHICKYGWKYRQVISYTPAGVSIGSFYATFALRCVWRCPCASAAVQPTYHQVAAAPSGLERGIAGLGSGCGKILQPLISTYVCIYRFVCTFTNLSANLTVAQLSTHILQ